MQQLLTHVIWTCPDCEHANNQIVDAPSLNSVDEKTGDILGCSSTDLNCDGCKTTFYGTALSDQDGVWFGMDKPNSFEVQGGMPVYEGPYAPPPPDDPYGIAREALDELRALIVAGEDAHLGDPQFRNRLVFSGAVAVFEAYLGDTIRNVVLGNRNTLVQYATTNDRMRGISLSVKMTDVKNDLSVLEQTVEDQLRNAVDENLRNVLYHNLAIVIAIYKSAGGIELTVRPEDKTELFRYMMLRHDCVHRNGASPEGEKDGDFNEAFVTQAVERISDTIGYVESQIVDSVTI